MVKSGKVPTFQMYILYPGQLTPTSPLKRENIQSGWLWPYRVPEDLQISDYGFLENITTWSICILNRFLCLQRNSPQSSAQGRAIINVSSGFSRFSAVGFSAYGALKAVVDTLTRYQALELAPLKIRVNAIAPGAIETDFAGGIVRDNPEMNN